MDVLLIGLGLVFACVALFGHAMRRPPTKGTWMGMDVGVGQLWAVLRRVR